MGGLAIILFSAAIPILGVPTEPVCFEWRSECMKKTGVMDNALFDALAQNKAHHKKYKEHLLCISEKAGAIGADGNYHQDKVMPGLLLLDDNQAEVEALIDSCWTDKKDTRETVAAVLICVLTQFVKDGKFTK